MSQLSSEKHHHVLHNVATPFLRGFLLNTLTEYAPEGYEPGPLIPGLWVEQNTEVQSAGTPEQFLIILGTCVPTHRDGTQVAEPLLEALSESEDRFHQELAEHVGRYAILYGTQETTKVVNDATAMRSVFYAAAGGVVASHALLVEQALGGTIRKSDMPFRYGYPGNATPYRRTKILTPNTYYNVATNRATRFWPTRTLKDYTPDNAAQQILDRTVQAIRNMAAQRPLKMALTAGLDSRTMLAVMLHSGVDFDTYTYGRGKDTLMDRNFARDLAHHMGVRHTVIEGVTMTPELRNRLDQANYSTHHKTTVPSLAAWIKDPTTAAVTANLLEIGRTFYQHAQKAGRAEPTTAEAMKNLHFRSIPGSGKAEINEWGQDTYDHVATELFADFLHETEFANASEFVGPFDLFYWEHRMSAWHGAAMVERDYYAEPFIPFNARTIFETMLGVPEEKRQSADVLYNIIKLVNPRLLDMPVNPKTWPLENSKPIPENNGLIPFTKDRDLIEHSQAIPVDEPQSFSPLQDPGISKYRAKLGRDTALDALFVNQKSDVLIVSCHGALPRQTTTLPRFERLRTFLNTTHSSLYFGDPTLHLNEQLGLAWYTGWKERDIYPILADWSQKAAEASGADKIIFLGSSGGGFASMQVATYVPNSLAVPLNPQTTIWRYQPKGSLGYARNYIRNVMPDLTPEGGVKNLTNDDDWSVPLKERASTLIRYSEPVDNYVYYAQNLNDTFHVTDHYEPFKQVIESGPNRDRVQFFTYEGQHAHASPRRPVFEEIMNNALEWLATNLP
jgi:hypothetical protein